MRGIALVLALACASFAAAWADPLPGAPPSAVAGSGSGAQSSTAVPVQADALPADAERPAAWAKPAPPEAALIPTYLDDAAARTLKGAAFAGVAGGMALTVWGLAGAAGAVAHGESQAALHGSLALAISGTVISAIFSALSETIGGH